MATNRSSNVRLISLPSDQVSEHSVIAAIDFGTSGSGYAFGFREKGSGDLKLSDIQLNKWQIDSASVSTDKAPTTVLLKPDKSFDSFGYKAEDTYGRLRDTKSHKGWWYFKKFKMMLYETKLSRDAVLHDAEDKTMAAIQVFGIVIAHLKESILRDVRIQNTSVQDDEVLYILTVPTIWSDAAKQFMREAATAPNVGIKASQLMLDLESEAASVYCRQRKYCIVREAEGNPRFGSLEDGHKYIIVDIGGGTAVRVTHQVIQNGKVQETHYSRGDNRGGQQFNENFLDFLAELLGEKVFERWRLNKHSDYLRLQRAIEGIKWDSGDSEEDILFELPFSLVKHFKNSGTSTKKLSTSMFSKYVKVIEDSRYLLKAGFVKGFFRGIIAGVIRHLSEISKHTSTIETVFMVGGLAKSAYIGQVIQAQFPQYKLIVPEDPGVAVLKGAVLLGNKPQTIACRIDLYSYGINVVSTFLEGKHDERHKINRNGKV